MMKRFLAFILMSLFGYNVTAGQCYYVSSSVGSDNNDGLSSKTPKKSLAALPKSNVTIRLKSGDVFWGGLSGYEGCTIESYGYGQRPVICGFKVLVNPDAWESVGECLWRLDLSDADAFAGNVIDVEPSGYNDIGFIYDAMRDKLYGRNMDSLDALDSEMDFFTSSRYSAAEVAEHPFRYVVVRRKKNPSELGNLCFPVFQSGIERFTDCTVRNIAIVGFSRMGMALMSGCNVENCQIDLIGGAIQIGYPKRARFGNGIELWDGYCDNTVSGCLISRTYDCATTIQANGDVKSNPRNNHFKGNRIYKCRQAFEHFLNPADGSLRQYVDCEFSDNICYKMGENDFDCPEMRDCNILSYEDREKAIVIRDNVFFGANHLDGTGIAEGMSDNVVYLYDDQYLYTRHWHPDRKTIVCNEDGAVERFRAIAPDNSKIVVLKRGSLRAALIEARIRRQINYQPVNLHLELL